MEENLNKNTELSLEEEKPSTFTDLKQYKNEKSYYDFVEEERQVIENPVPEMTDEQKAVERISKATCALS